MFTTATYRPISFKDPTGLEPEKEKGGEDEMLWTIIETDNETFFAIQSQILLEHEIGVQKQIAMKHMYEAIVNEAYAKFWYGQYRFDIGGGGGSGGGSGARKGTTASLSFTYNRNGLSGTVNIGYDPEKTSLEEAIRGVAGWIDWIAESPDGHKRLFDYFNDGGRMNVDITRSGEELASFWDDKCDTDYGFLAGFSSNCWDYDSYEDGIGCNTGSENGWIYMASEYIDDKYSNRYYYFYTNHDLSVENREYHYGFTVFAHEFGHTYDSIFVNHSIYREDSANMFLASVWNYHNPNYRFYISSFIYGPN